MSETTVPECVEPKADKPDFHLEEYKLLREEILHHLKEIHQTETFAAIAIVSVYSWLLTHTQSGIPHLAWFIPPFIVVVAIFRCWDLTVHITAIGEYLLDVEKWVFQNDAEALGWEHHKRSKKMAKTSVRMAAFVWAIVFGGVLFASIHLSHLSEAPQTQVASPTSQPNLSAPSKH